MPITLSFLVYGKFLDDAHQCHSDHLIILSFIEKRGRSFIEYIISYFEYLSRATRRSSLLPMSLSVSDSLIYFKYSLKIEKIDLSIIVTLLSTMFDIIIFSIAFFHNHFPLL